MTDKDKTTKEMKWDISGIKNWGPHDHELGSLIPEAGNARYYHTGGWRTEFPIRDEETCTQCLFCYFFCPDSSVLAENQKVTDFDYDHCKGCGICAKECPADAITMHPESEFAERVKK
ncbi:MAG TPA: 4Fe-4S binding protein [Thermoleophilia bacterium]|nr:4Fe-4S binding protein [Thermoleophilia bacterium]